MVDKGARNNGLCHPGYGSCLACVVVVDVVVVVVVVVVQTKT